MKKLFQKNHIIILVLVVMIAAAGFFNFAQGKKGEEKVQEAMNQTEGTYELSDEDAAMVEEGLEASLVDDQGELKEMAEAEEESVETKEADGQEQAKAEEHTGEAVLVSNTINGDFFASAKLSREQTRAKNKETLMSLVDDKSLDEAQKQQALDEVIRMTDFAEKENAAEILLESKGFGNAVVTMADGGVDVIVAANELTRQHLAQIEDIVKRKTGVNVSDIVINPVALE